ncbi:MAG: thioredoxin family protein [Candidatus Pacearchaeota archaeon]|nr:thioredoxin family protein [Candidatus Pacearchaeota archaeon]
MRRHKLFLLFFVVAILFLSGCKNEILILKDKKTIPEPKCIQLEKYIFIYETGCPHCDKFFPVIRQVEKELNVSFKKYNLAIEEDFKELQKMKIIPEGIPCVIISCRVYIGAGYTAQDLKKAILESKK